MPPSPRRIINRLPPDSTLLTPLPSYPVSSTTSVPMMEPLAFPSGTFDLGDDNSRPSTGYTNTSSTFLGGDEHDQHRV
ncbi:hypothetical protein NMY22_g13788 [Coprinellus aureogranulatus]|nr:hypothetical protein NMY22_g13788 [Coprinellus aureogranulatus]